MLFLLRRIEGRETLRGYGGCQLGLGRLGQERQGRVGLGDVLVFADDQGGLLLGADEGVPADRQDDAFKGRVGHRLNQTGYWLV